MKTRFIKKNNLYLSLLELFVSFCFITNITGCSFFIESDNKFKQISGIESNYPRPLDQLYCPNSTLIEVSKNGKFQKNKISNSGHIAEQIVQNYWQEQLSNPDYFVSHPRIQIFIKSVNQFRYFDNYENKANKENINFNDSLNLFLKKEKSNKNALQIRDELFQKIKNDPITSNTLSRFIKENQEDFNKNDILKKLFLKGDDALAPYESFFPLNFIIKQNPSSNSKFIKLQQNPIEKNTNDDNKIYDHTINQNIIRCNFELNVFQNFTSSLLETESLDSYYFSRSIDKENFYLVVLSSHISKPINIDPSTGLILASPSKNPVPFCFSQKSNNDFLFALSTMGRDPAQHISHFIDYGFFDAESITDLLGHMKFTRHLFLKNPDRLLIESQKARDEQISFFYTMNIPLYHIDKLGEILFYGKFQNSTQHSFVADERSEAQVICRP